MGTAIILVYNLDIMSTNMSPKITRAERDPSFFVWFVTLVILGIYVVTLINRQSVRQPGYLFIFTLLTIIHVLLHWQLGRIINNARKTNVYILVQGLLAFGILLFAQNIYIIIALHMILLGEAIGQSGITRRSLLAVGYVMVLLCVNLIYLSGWAASGRVLLNTIPIVVFVIAFISLYMRQNEAREKAQSLAAELESTNQQLSKYAAQVEELTLAAERQRLARELHDTLSQGLTGLVLQLEAVKAHLEAGRTERAGAIIKQSLVRARSTLADSRSAIDDLRAVPAGITEAMRAKTERFTMATGIPCELSLELGDTTPPSNMRDHLLLILKESLANVTRHAQARQVWVRLEAKNHHLEMEIRDDGQGFEPGMETGAGHYGLLGMRERARLVGGTLEIKSATGKGTCIRLTVPINQED